MASSSVLVKGFTLDAGARTVVFLAATRVFLKPLEADDGFALFFGFLTVAALFFGAFLGLAAAKNNSFFKKQKTGFKVYRQSGK